MGNFWKTLKKPIIGLAPMSGITDEPMRLLQAGIQKPDVMYTEFVSVTGFRIKPDYFLKVLTFDKAERPIVAQVFGSIPEDFYLATKHITGLGFDGIDINMGCPARTVVERGGGAALIGNTKLAGEIIAAICQAIRESGQAVAVSVKTRISREKTETLEWFDFLGNMPIHCVCVHGRTIEQRSVGEVNWEYVREAAKILKESDKTVLGNGGIRSIREAAEKCRQFGLDGVLIGQAAFGNPWIFRGTEIPGKGEILNTIANHAKMAWQFYGRKDFIKVRKHFSWYPRYFSGSKQLRVELLKTQNLDQALSVVEKFRNRDTWQT